MTADNRPMNDPFHHNGAGYALIQSTVNPDIVLLRVDADVLPCAYRVLPYSTYLGTISRSTRKIQVWTPAASKPRGYRAAAKAALEYFAESSEL